MKHLRFRFSLLRLVIIVLAIANALVIARPQKNRWEKMSVSKSLDRLVVAIRKHHPEVKMPEQLTGIGGAELKQIRAELPDAPDQLFELLQRFDFECAALFDLDVHAPIEFSKNVQRQLKFYEEADGMLEGNLSGWTSSSHGCCKLDRSWREGWIPFGSSNGDSMFIDMDPADKGIAGQIVAVHEDGKYLTVKGYSLAHWLERVAENVESGNTSDSFGYTIYLPDRIDPPCGK